MLLIWKKKSYTWVVHVYIIAATVVVVVAAAVVGSSSSRLVEVVLVVFCLPFPLFFVPCCSYTDSVLTCTVLLVYKWRLLYCSFILLALPGLDHSHLWRCCQLTSIILLVIKLIIIIILVHWPYNYSYMWPLPGHVKWSHFLPADKIPGLHGHVLVYYRKPLTACVNKIGINEWHDL